MRLRNPFDKVKRIEKSMLNKDSKKLTEFDIEFLHMILVRKQNEIYTVLNNEKFYSEKTLKEYGKLKDSVNRLLRMVDCATCGLVTEIPTTW